MLMHFSIEHDMFLLLFILQDVMAADFVKASNERIAKYTQEVRYILLFILSK